MPTVTRSLMRARRRSLAVRLIESLLRQGMTETTLAGRLAVEPGYLADVRSGRRRLRWLKQVLLAASAETHSPALAGQVANLRAQLAAIVEYRDRVASAGWSDGEPLAAPRRRSRSKGGGD